MSDSNNPEYRKLVVTDIDDSDDDLRTKSHLSSIMDLRRVPAGAATAALAPAAHVAPAVPPKKLIVSLNITDTDTDPPSFRDAPRSGVKLVSKKFVR